MGASSIDPSFTGHEQIVATIERKSLDISRREAVTEALLMTAFTAVVLTLLATADTGSVSLLPLVAVTIALALAERIEFNLAAAWTAPTQLALLPLLFVVPAPLVPLAAVAAAVLAKLPEVSRGELAPSRLLLVPSGTWFAVGPAVVLALTGHATAGAPAEVLALVVLAQVGGDYLVFLARSLLLGEPLAGHGSDAAVIYAIDLALTPTGLVLGAAAARAPWTVLAVLPLLAVLEVYARERRERMRSATELSHAYRGTAYLLGDVVEADDLYTGEHCRDVVELALALGRQLDMSAEELRDLEFAALLHDVGKIAIPKAIINKPGKLDAAERAIIETHTEIGQAMLDRIGGFMTAVGTIVRSHHERWDGGGYPDGLAGTAIPTAARIISVCDSYSAMTTDRSYRAAMPKAAALAELLACRGSQFDPAVVDAMHAATAAQQDRASAA